MEHVKTILRNATRKENDHLNVITYSTHERYETGFQNLNMTFHLWQTKYAKPWKYEYAPLPKNHIMLPGRHEDRQLQYYITPDVVISQNKLAHYQTSVEISKRWNIPLICLEHTTPMPSWSDSYITQLSKMKGNLNVFISEYSMKAWKAEGIVIKHGIDTDLFTPKNLAKHGYVLSAVNDWRNRDEPCGWTLWTQISGFPDKKYLPVKIVGDNPGISKPTPNVEALVHEYNQAAVFLNTSQHSPIPTVVMEAMSCGVPVVSTNNYMIPEIITHGEDGFLSNNPLELRQYCLDLLRNDKMREEMGKKARQKILNEFTIDKFEQNWNKAIRSVL